MRRVVLGLAFVASVVLAVEDGASQSRRLGQVAPEIAGDSWVNSEPLTTAGLRGRVILVEFWTYG